MSLIVGIRAAEGLVLATDSLLRREDAIFLTARKLFTFPSQPNLAVAICGRLSIGHGELHPIAVLMEAFSAELDAQTQLASKLRVTTADFAEQLGAYLAAVWSRHMPPEDKATLQVVVAGFDAGKPFGELYWLEVPGQLTPQLQRWPHHPFFTAYWGYTPGVSAMGKPYSFPFDIMPLQDCADLAEHLITSTARLEAWSDMRQSIGGPVQLVTIMQAAGAQRVIPDPSR